MSTMQRVREAISHSHDTIEQTDFAKSLMDGRITRNAYGVYLGQIMAIHDVLERVIIEQEEVANYFQASMVRTSAISRDATSLDQELSTIVTLAETKVIVEQLENWAVTTPYALLGALYILEGSRMGSMMIGRALIKSLKLEAVASHASSIEKSSEARATLTIPGVEYHLEDVANTPRRVKEFKAAIDAAGLSEQHEQELTLGACIFMQMLLDLYRVLPVSLGGAASSTMRCPMHGMHEQSGSSVYRNLRSA